MIRRTERKVGEEAGRSPHMPDALAPSSFERDCRTLETGMLIDRVLAVRRLGNLGSAALLPLCRALEDPCPQVRIVAADALGSLADPRAVPALHAALRRSLWAGSGPGQLRWERFSRWVGPACATACLVAAIPHAIHSLPGSIAVGVMLPWSILTLCSSKWRRDLHPLQCSLVSALGKIATANGGPEVRVCLPELKALAQTGWQQTRPAATDLADTLKLIESLPAPSSYPLPAAGDRVPGMGLPLITDAGVTSANVLPVPAIDGGNDP